MGGSFVLAEEVAHKQSPGLDGLQLHLAHVLVAQVDVALVLTGTGKDRGHLAAVFEVAFEGEDLHREVGIRKLVIGEYLSCAVGAGVLLCWLLCFELDEHGREQKLDFIVSVKQLDFDLDHAVEVVGVF
jgi:hypothetical protein